MRNLIPLSATSYNNEGGHGRSRFASTTVVASHRSETSWEATELYLPDATDDVERVRRQYQESEQRFRALLESLPKVAVQGYDRDRRVIYWNEASTTLYGYTAEEASGRRLEDLIIPDEMREDMIEAHRAGSRKGRRFRPKSSNSGIIAGNGYQCSPTM